MNQSQFFFDDIIIKFNYLLTNENNNYLQAELI
jgi:hypothetical protein